MARTPQKGDNGARNNAQPEAAQGTDENPLRVATVPPPPNDGDVDGPTPQQLKQRDGLAPLDAQRNQEQADKRHEMTNMQTDFEMANAHDPISGTPTPGVTENTPLTARQMGAPATDESGRPALTAPDKELVPQLRQKLQDAQKEDADDDSVPRDQKGFRTPEQLGIPGGVVQRIFSSLGEDGPLEAQVVPNGHFFPETGTRYRVKR